MNKKSQLLINTALDLFYQHGINTIGINEVLKISGVAKKTLYNHFESKEALILAALEQRHNVFTDWLGLKLQGAKSNHDMISQLFTALEAWFTSSDSILGDFRGCFFINSSAEFSDKNSLISIYCQQHKQQIKRVIQLAMPVADAVLLDTICIMKEGAIVTAYVTGDHAVAKRCIQILNN